MTNNSAVSKIEGNLRGVNKDARIPRRLILQTLRENTRVLISQKLLDRTITEELNLYSYIPCIEFDKVDTIKCPIVEFRLCRTLMKSKNKIPEPVYSRLGASIKNVTSVDGMQNFTIISATQYARNKKRQHQLSGEHYIYLAGDRHLYIPDEEIYSVDLDLLTQQTEFILECSSCSKDECKSGWEAEFICPNKLENAVFDKTLQQLLGSYKQITPDENPNGSELEK